MDYQKNDLLTIEIEDIGNDGEGIGKKDGYTFFIKDAILGDTVEARITKPKKNYAYARTEKVLVPSVFRVKPKCILHKQCGGCQIQALSYEKQLEYKHNKVKNHLIRIGKFDEKFIEDIIEPIVAMETPYFYRNKAQFPFATGQGGKPITGFYAGRTHAIISNTDCVLGIPENEKILNILLNHMEKYRIAAYNEEENKGLLRHALIRKGFTTGEIMVCLILNGSKIPYQKELIKELCELKGMTSISISSHTEKTNVIMGKTARTIWGQDYITDCIGTIKFSISPLSFYQVNPVQTERLYGLALEYAGLTGSETVWDLYCGIGTISLFLSQKAKQVYGVEIVQEAIEDAKNNAIQNNITNASFYVGKAEEVLPEKYEKEGIHADVIVVDPPRKGCDERCLETMIKMQPEKIVYVSCDSSTLARDLRYLCDHGYEIKRARAVDQFCHTVHVETCVLLSHKNS